MSKLIFFDVETSGVNFWQHGIHQLSGIIEIDGEEVQRFNYQVQLHPAALIDDEALKVGHTTRERVANYCSQESVHKEFLTCLALYVNKFDPKDKFHLVGYNSAAFDNPFLRAFFKQCGDDYFGSWFWSCPIDVMVLAGQYLMAWRPTMKDFKQSSVAKQFGIEIDESRLHDADYDVEVLRSIYRYMYPI